MLLVSGLVVFPTSSGLAVMTMFFITIHELLCLVVAGAYHGDSDLQLERINVYFNEAQGKEQRVIHRARSLLWSLR